MLSVSILDIKTDEKLKKLDELDFDYIHVDVMDNKFVPNITKDFEKVKKQFQNIKHPLDIHLMTYDLISYIDTYKGLNPEYITFHVEATKNPVLVIEHIKKNNIKVGISIKPDTDISKIRPYLNIVDLVLVMSVNPGYGGQKFIDITDKIKELKKISKDYNYNYLIEVDGGINNKTVKLVKDADLVVVGSYIVSSNNYKTAIDRIKSNLK